MNIELKEIGKQFNREWICRSVSLSFSSEDRVHLRGHNGSGKSTLLKLIAGLLVPSKGKLIWKREEEIERSLWSKHFSICAPYVDLFESYTLSEAVNFHFSFKTVLQSVTINEVLEIAYLDDSANKKVSELSSGMKQRLKLALAILSQCDVLFLDEPCANLDQKAIDWYQLTLKKYLNNRILIICSNDKAEEHFMCNKTINLEDYK